MALTAGSAAFSAATTGTTPGAKASTSPLPIPSTPFTGFGGYDWFGTTTSISARWVVPTILTTEQNEQGVSASTWIGSQSSTTNAFIQLGVTEQRFTSAPPAYEAFWSDTRLGFLAQPIHVVAAGDDVSASMTQGAAGWTLQIDDLTADWTRTVRTDDEAGAHFTQGQWLQEDPPPSLHTARDLPYPATTLVAFTDVKINGRTPVLPFDDAQALSGFGGIFLVPTSFRDDGFALPPAHGAARQYLADAARYDAVLETVDNALIASSEPPSAAQRRRAVGRLVDAMTAFDSSLATQTWPASAAADMRQLVHADEQIAGDYRRAEEEGFRLPAAVARQVLRDFTEFHVTVEDARAGLGLPPT
jgi:hypothetical protein